MKTFSQAVQATLASVREQMARTCSQHASTSLIARHARKHTDSTERRIVAPVVEAVRDELAYARAVSGIDAKACDRLIAGLRRSM